MTLETTLILEEKINRLKSIVRTNKKQDYNKKRYYQNYYQTVIKPKRLKTPKIHNETTILMPIDTYKFKAVFIVYDKFKIEF